MEHILDISTEKIFNKIQDISISDLDTLIQEIEIDKLVSYHWLDELIQKKNFTKSQVAQYFGGTNYIYEICNGSKHPSRDKLLETLLIINASLKEIQFTLKVFRYSPLYPKDTRDLYIIYGIENQLSILKLNDLLLEKGLNSF